LSHTLHPYVPAALAALYSADLIGAVTPADGGGDQIRIIGPAQTFVLVGSPEVLPDAGEPLTTLHAQLHTPDGDFLDVSYHACTDPECCATPGTLDLRTFAHGIAGNLREHAPNLPTTPPTLADVLHTVADLMDADNARTTAMHGTPIGIPTSFIDALTNRAVYGSDPQWFARRFARIGREQGNAAVREWGNAHSALRQKAAHLIWPGPHAPMLRPDEIRELAVSLSA